MEGGGGGGHTRIGVRAREGARLLPAPRLARRVRAMMALVLSLYICLGISSLSRCFVMYLFCEARDGFVISAVFEGERVPMGSADWVLVGTVTRILLRLQYKELLEVNYWGR